MEKNFAYKSKKTNKFSHSKLRGIIFGLFLLAAGLILILGNFNFIDKELFKYIFSWQSLLIILGILLLAGGIKQHWFGSLILITIGGVFLFEEIYKLKTGLANMIWPAILIIIGIAILIKMFSSKNKLKHIAKTDKNLSGEVNNEDFIDCSKVFSVANILVKSQNFKGGSASFVFGGGEIDLRQAQLAEGLNILKLECVFGGLKILVPNTWDVSIETSSVFGGFNDEREINIDNIDKTKKLLIKAEAVFGRAELCN